MEGLVYKAVVGFIKGQENVYIDSSEGTFKARYYIYKSSFKQPGNKYNTKYGSNIWEMKENISKDLCINYRE